MKQITSILKEYGNQALSTITGYPVEHIKMFRKNDIDHYAIKTDSLGRGIPTRRVMETKIVEKVNQHEDQVKQKRCSFISNVIPVCS